MTKDTDKGIGLEQEIDPGWQDDQHQPQLPVFEQRQKVSSRVGDQECHQGDDSGIKDRIKAHL